MLAHQADAAETRSRHLLRSPIELPEPTRLGLLAPLSAQLGESPARSRSISRPLLRGAAAHQLAHSSSAPVYTVEMAARWEAAASSQGGRRRGATGPPHAEAGPRPRRDPAGNPLGRQRLGSVETMCTTLESEGSSP